MCTMGHVWCVCVCTSKQESKTEMQRDEMKEDIWVQFRQGRLKTDILHKQIIRHTNAQIRICAQHFI